MIISASRRTDIPAFYTDWFMQRIQQGKVVTYNPYNKLGTEVSLKPEDVDAIVFWSKNYGPLIPKLDELRDKYKLYFLFTITGLSRILEEKVINVEKAIEQFIYISEKFSKEHIQWRFDPIVITNRTTEDFYIHQFSKLAKRLESYTKRCYISFATIYPKVARTFNKVGNEKGIYLIEYHKSQMRNIANKISNIGENFGIEVFSCCNDFLIGNQVAKASCIDVNAINKIYSTNIKSTKNPTRSQCGCYKSVDIGVYNTCPHGCWYCYANYDKNSAIKNYKNHDPQNEFLLNRKIEVVKKLQKEQNFGQISLF